MAGLLYYAPGLSGTLSLADVQAIGLGHAFSATPTCREVQTHTPDKQSGLLLIDRSRLKTADGGTLAPKMDMESQHWEEVASPDGKQPLYCGHYIDHPPTPADLMRDDTLPGGLIRMGDGNDWELPLIRRFDEATEGPASALPATYRLDREGQMVPAETLPRWRWLWDATEDAWLAMVNEVEATNQEMLVTAGKIFSANYAVSHIELGYLRCFYDGMNTATVCAICMDYITF